MSYGLVITNPDGKILIDGERKMPKLIHHGRYYLQTRSHEPYTGYTYYADVSFTPTPNPVFVTQAIDETIDYGTPRRAYLRTPYVFRNAQNQFYKARVESVGTKDRWGKIYVFVWVYEL